MRLKGKVIRGRKKATTLGYPTANVEIVSGVVVPGIYAGRAFIDGITHKAAIFVGLDNTKILETHVIDFEGDLYDKEIEVFVGRKLRNVFVCNDEEKLRNMIANDVQLVRVEIDGKF